MMNNNKKILLDMDGVLADFTKGVCVAHGRENPFDSGYRDYQIEKAWDISEEEFWKPTGTIEFWSNLEKFEWADRLVYLCIGLVGIENVAFCTSPSTYKTAECIGGKTEWLDRNFPKEIARIFTKRKDFCADPNTILIDDTDLKLNEFAYAGGKVVRFPQPWNVGWKESGERNITKVFDEIFRSVTLPYNTINNSI